MTYACSGDDDGDGRRGGIVGQRWGLERLCDRWYWGSGVLWRCLTCVCGFAGGVGMAASAVGLM